MNRYGLTVLSILFVAVGCKSVPEARPVIEGPATVLQPAHGTAEVPPAQVKIVEIHIPSPQLRPISGTKVAEAAEPKNAEAKAELESGDGVNPVEMTAEQKAQAIIRAAKTKATNGPDGEGFIQATQYFDYLPGVLYQAYCSPGYITTIVLKPGEKLISRAAGDTTRWQVESTTSGGEGGAQTIIIVKPLRSGLNTNLIVTTDQRLYQIELMSVEGSAYNATVAWHYPNDSLVTRADGLPVVGAGQQADATGAVQSGINIQNLDFNYSITLEGDSKAERPQWMPTRVFTDGKKTYIQFPPDLGVTEAPPLFILKNKTDTEGEIVNYRIKSPYYIVDQVLQTGALRMGDLPQTMVWIQRHRSK